MLSNFDQDEFYNIFFGLKKTYDTDPVLVGSKRALKTITTTTDDFFKEVATMNITDLIRTPDIINYTYTPHIGLTTIEWSDGTKTTVRAEDPAKADQYTGFVTAYAKKAAGNTNNINNLFDKWAIERPKRETKRMCDEMVARIEAQKKQERDNKKREKRTIRREALRLKREYEAKKLAKEKYGVPVDEL